MSAKKLAAVQKVLTTDVAMGEWYAEQHNVRPSDFTVQNVREYGLNGMGEIADQIIADGEDAGVLQPDDLDAA